MTTAEKKLWRSNFKLVNSKAPVQPGEEIIINVRGRVTEVGPEMCVVDMVELREQGRVAHPVLVFVPHELIRMSRIERDKLPPEVKN